MAIQYYMRGYDAILDTDVDWVVNDTPDTSGTYSGYVGLTNIRVNRTVQSPVDSLIKPSIPLFVSDQIPNIDPNFLYLNSYDWLHPGSPSPSPPSSLTGLMVMRGSDVSPPTPNNYAGLYWYEFYSQWTLNFLDSVSNPVAGSISLAIGTNTPTTGVIRIPNNEFITSLDSTSTDTPIIGINSSDKIEIGDTTHSTYIASRLEVNDGSLINPIASTGLIRLPNTVESSIAVRNSANNSDLIIFSVYNDDLVIGDTTNNTNIKYNVGNISGAHKFFVNNNEIVSINNSGQPKIYFSKDFIAMTAKINIDANTDQSWIGRNLEITAQSASGLGSTGGNLILSSGIGEPGVLANIGKIYLDAGGYVAEINHYGLDLHKSIKFKDYAGSIFLVPGTVGISQETINHNGPATVLSIKAQDNTSTDPSATGGDLILTSGDCSVTNGIIGFNVGGIRTAELRTNKFITKKGRRRQVDSIDATAFVLSAFTIPDGYDVTSIDNLASAPGLTIYLPAFPTKGDTYTIKDADGGATTNPIIIDGNFNNIDGAATFPLNVNYQSLDVIYNGTEWSII